MQKIVEVLPDKTGLIERALAVVLDKMQSAFQSRGTCTIALAGGSTPKPLYEALAAQDLPWEKIHVFWGDERYVPPSHPDSNAGMARSAWLDRVDMPAANIHPMPTDGDSLEKDAAKHDAQLREFFGVPVGAHPEARAPHAVCRDSSAYSPPSRVRRGEQFPAFDVILLGMGDDGHTASLFPHTEALNVRDRLVTVGNKDGTPRITFAIPLINQARCVLFMVAGANKKPALAQIFAPAADERAYPARMIQPQGELWWLLDGAAGSEMQNI